MDIPFRPEQRLYRTPPISLNWSLRGSLVARHTLKSMHTGDLDALFVHTMTVGLLAANTYESVPTMISIDATPVNLDDVGRAYGHRRQPGPIEYVKKRLVMRVAQRAKGFVAWSEWAKASLVSDYGVPPEQVTVITPGTDLDLFQKLNGPPLKGKPRILFVGGDFERKGGDLLLSVFRERLAGKAELHLVTGADIVPEEGVFAHKGLTSNSEALLNLYRTSDIFTLPTRADCLAVVLGEAMAASLPIVTTRVGAHPEAVDEGQTGFIIEPDDAVALGDALETLVDNQSLRKVMGSAGRHKAEMSFDAKANAKRILGLIQGMA
jgi:glycosyltransferase involved in cell wall biosynthesis